MSIATLIEKVVGKQQARRAADFRDLVVQIADGHEPDADCVADVLREADKSLEDLQKAVDLLERRREWRRQYDRLPELAAERNGIQRQIAAADKVLEAAEREHYSTVQPLIAELQRISGAEDEGRKAKQELVDTYADESCLDKLADVRLRLSARRDEAAGLTSEPPGAVPGGSSNSAKRHAVVAVGLDSVQAEPENWRRRCLSTGVSRRGIAAAALR